MLIIIILFNYYRRYVCFSRFFAANMDLYLNILTHLILWVWLACVTWIESYTKKALNDSPKNTLCITIQDIIIFKINNKKKTFLKPQQFFTQASPDSLNSATHHIICYQPTIYKSVVYNMLVTKILQVHVWNRTFSDK